VTGRDEAAHDAAAMDEREGPERAAHPDEPARSHETTRRDQPAHPDEPAHADETTRPLEARPAGAEPVAARERKATPGHAGRPAGAVGSAWARALGAGLVAVALGVAARLLYGRGTVGYDAAWALLWGQQLARGEVPDLDAVGAPTPHPLANVVSAVLGSPDLVLAVSWLAFGALGVAAYALGTALYSRWVGGLFAALLLTRPLLVLEAGQAVIDVPFLALVVAAMAHEARRPRSGWTVPVLLGLAGLLRPEAWLLGLAWAVWAAQVRADRLALAAAALAPPVLWALSDWAATGDPLHSLHGTQALAAQLGRPRELDTALRSTPGYLRYAVTEPVVWIGLAGCAAAVTRLYTRSLLPLAVAGLGLLAFLALGVSGLPLLSRYLLLPATLLALWCAVAALGFTVVRSRLFVVGGVLALAALAATAPGLVDRLRGMVSFVDARASVERDLTAILAAAPVAAALERCPTLSLPDDAPRPHARRLLPTQVAVGREGAVTLRYADERARDVFRIGPAAPPGAPVGQRVLADNTSWIMAVPGRCAGD